MKKIISKFALVLFFTICSNIGFAQTQGKSLLNMTTYESMDGGYSKIIVVDNDKKIEEIALAKFYYKDLELNQITINKTLLNYQEKGYKVIAELRGAVGLIMVTTYRLEK